MSMTSVDSAKSNRSRRRNPQKIVSRTSYVVRLVHALILFLAVNTYWKECQCLMFVGYESAYGNRVQFSRSGRKMEPVYYFADGPGTA